MSIVPNSIVTIDLCHSEYLVWSADDVLSLRRHHRIIGVCVGSLSWKPRQTIHTALPLRLSKIEAAFLILQGFAHVRKSNSFDDSLFPVERKLEIEKSRLMQKDAQIVVLRQQKSSELDALAPTILGGLRTANAGNASDSFEAFKAAELGKTTSRMDDQLWIKMEVSSEKTNALPINDEYKFSLNEKEKLMFDVFCDLHSQGYYLTNACKFGGDFLVYPGDPAAYHSFYIAICVPHERKLTGLEYSKYGRLANTVRKTLLICSKHVSGHIEYLSVSWTGIAQSDDPKI